MEGGKERKKIWVLVYTTGPLDTPWRHPTYTLCKHGSQKSHLMLNPLEIGVSIPWNQYHPSWYSGAKSEHCISASYERTMLSYLLMWALSLGRKRMERRERNGKSQGPSGHQCLLSFLSFRDTREAAVWKCGGGGGNGREDMGRGANWIVLASSVGCLGAFHMGIHWLHEALSGTTFTLLGHILKSVNISV